MEQLEDAKTLLSTAKSKLSARQKNQEDLRQLWAYKDAQSLIGIDKVIDGLVFTTDGRIVNIIEILPVNYYERSDVVKDSIATSFGFNFKQLPDNGQFKVMYINTNLDKFEENVRKHTLNENNPNLKERVDDYIKHVRFLQKENSICRRFFFIYEYEGDDDGKKTDDYETILSRMMQIQNEVLIAFSEMGNAVIPLNENGDSKEIVDVLYKFYNPQTSQSESLDNRIKKVFSTASYFGQTPSVSDYIAPRGIQFGKWDYVAFDGLCHSYLMLRDNSYPTQTFAGWLNSIISCIDNGDLDIFYRKANSALNTMLIDRTDVISRSLSYRHNDSEQDKQEELSSKADNARYLKTKINKEGEDFYEVCIMVTLRAKSSTEMGTKTSAFIKKMKSDGFFFDRCSLNTMTYFKMAAPTHHIENSIFKNYQRNMTNSSLSTLYCFSSFEMFDRNGYCLGYKAKKNNNTLFAVDNFNKIYPNPHIFIAGTTGAGKTFTEMNITSRMRMNGIRTMYILPLKGHEYKDIINSLGGSYIKVAPGEPVCINICEIRPSDKININSIDDKDLADALKGQASFLSQKVTLLINWVRMLLDEGERLSRDEAGELNIAFTRVYSKFGITDDNMSVFNRDGSVKKMPIIEDLYNEIKDIPMLSRVTSAIKPWVFGNCKNMNGQTNVDLTNMTIGFDVNEDIIGEELLPAFMLICFDICYGIAQRDLTEKCCIVLDETWKFLMIPECAKYIFKMIKILRAYKTCMITATQDIEDCMRFEYGRVLLTLSATKIYLRMDKNEIDALSTSVTFSEQNIATIQKLPPGYGFYCFNDDRVLVKFDLSDLELEIYEPDPDKKAQIRANRLAKG